MGERKRRKGRESSEHLGERRSLKGVEGERVEKKVGRDKESGQRVED